MGTNLALNAIVTASSYIDPYEPKRATNGVVTDQTSRWLCGSLPGWMTLDLGAVYWVKQWNLKSIGGNAGWPVNYCMTNFSLQTSPDGNAWTTVDTVANNTANTCSRNLATPASARYWRLSVPDKGGLTANKDAASVMEIELIQIDPTPNTLSALTITGNGTAVSTTPAFASSTTSYTASVTYDVASVVVSPTATDPNAVMKVNGTPVARGGNATVPLNVGSNAVTVVVTPTIGDPQTYTVTVTKASSQYLSGFTLKVGKNLVTYTPSFDRTVTRYTATAPAGSTGIVVTPTAEDPAASINVKGTVVTSGQTVTVAIATGTNAIPMIVTSSIGAITKEYDLTVTV